MVSIGSPWRVIRTIIHLVVDRAAATDIVKFGAIALAVAARGADHPRAARARPGSWLRGGAPSRWCWPGCSPGPTCCRGTTRWAGRCCRWSRWRRSVPGGAGLAAARPDGGARLRLPARPAGRRDAAARARLAAARDQARGDARGPGRGDGLAGGPDGAFAAVGAARTGRGPGGHRGAQRQRRDEGGPRRVSTATGVPAAAGGPRGARRAGLAAWPGGWAAGRPGRSPRSGCSPGSRRSPPSHRSSAGT